MSSVIFEPTEKQQTFIDACFSGIFKFLFYGGAAGGGKTYVGLGILILLCKIFPNSKWCVVRKDFAKLKQNTIPSFKKLCPRRFLVKLIDGIAYFTNGSQIIFKGENYTIDNDLTWMDGFEVNGFLFEEAQELNKKLFEKAKLRAGRHIIPNMPPILIIITGNPSQNWSKKIFVEPHKSGTLESPYYFMQALMNDNPYLPKQYIENMDTLDTNTYEKFVRGNWDIIDVEKPFAYMWKDKLIKILNKPLKPIPVYLSFDFNVDPITCIACQHTSKWIRVHKEYRLRDSNIYALCEAIKKDHDGYYFYATGDASGASRSAMTRENLTYYIIIKSELNLSNKQMLVPLVNPIISNNRVLVNSLLEKHQDFSIHFECEYLINDLRYVEVNEYGEIDKKKDKRRTHLLDCLRYYFNTFHSGFVKYKF